MISPRDDLTFTDLKIYYNGRGIVLNDSFLKTLEFLTSDGKLNFAAYLMADYPLPSNPRLLAGSEKIPFGPGDTPYQW